MRALILNNKVVQVAENDFPVAGDLTWMDAPEGCEFGWVLNNDVLEAPPEPPLDPEDMLKLYSMVVKDVLLAKATEKNYESEDSIVGYISSANQQWQNEAQQFIAWRDSVWEYAINIQQEVEAQNIPAPTLDDFKNGLPALNW